MTNIELAAGLRALADFYETHPEMPLPAIARLHVWVNDNAGFRTAKTQMSEDANFQIHIDDAKDIYPQAHLTRGFGSLELHVIGALSTIGRKVMKMVESWELIPEEPAVETLAHNPLKCEDAECVACNEVANAQ